MTLARGQRRKMPDRRLGYNQKIKLDGRTIHLRTSEYEDGTLGEIWLDMAKTGSFARAMLNAFAIAISKSLQHGVPLEMWVKTYKDFNFPPNGPLTGDVRFQEAKSILDYVFRELESTYLSGEAQNDSSGGSGTGQTIPI